VDVWAGPVAEMISVGIVGHEVEIDGYGVRGAMSLGLNGFEFLLDFIGGEVCGT